MIKILVLDDDVDLLEMVSTVLRNREGLRIYALQNCTHLFAALKSEIPDLLIMDINLGPCDGRNLCRQLKQMHEFQQIPVLLYSAAQIEPQSIIDSKAERFMAKPFNIATLLSNVDQLVHPA